MRDERSVMGDQFQITLPSGWRNDQDVVKGSKVHAHYGPNSVLIITSSLRAPTAVENQLIDLLIRFPELAKSRELMEALRKSADMIETAMITPLVVMS